jgi:hypothetical protein
MDGWAVTAVIFGVLEDTLSTLLDETPAEGNGFARLHADARDAMAQPDSVDSAGVVSNGGAELLETSGEAFHFQPLQSADDRAFYLKEQLGDRSGWWKRLVSSGEVEQEILDATDAEPGVQPRADGADAFE